MKPSDMRLPGRPRCIIAGTQYAGTCRKIVDGKPCGMPFVGAKNRRFCDKHSPDIRYRGRG